MAFIEKGRTRIVESDFGKQVANMLANTAEFRLRTFGSISLLGSNARMPSDAMFESVSNIKSEELLGKIIEKDNSFESRLCATYSMLLRKS